MQGAILTRIGAGFYDGSFAGTLATQAGSEMLRRRRAERSSERWTASAGDDQALAFGWKQTKCNAELGEDKGELSNLCQTGGNDESRVVGPRSKRTIRSAAAKKRALKAFWTGCN